MDATKGMNGPLLDVRWIHGSPAAGPADPPLQVRPRPRRPIYPDINTKIELALKI
jgi:hypothetical protein